MEKPIQQLSQLTGKSNYPQPPKRPGKPLSYDKLLMMDPSHEIVMKYDMEFMAYENLLVEYNEKRREFDPVGYEADEKAKKDYFRKINGYDQAKEFNISEINSKSLYDLFKFQFEKTNGKKFDESFNDGESAKLAFSLVLYFLKNEKFLESPLINKISEPSLQKGLLIIGGYGCSKTSILKTFNELFLDAQNSPNLSVYTNSKVILSLGLFSLKFGYKTANGIIDEYEACENENEKVQFWQRNTKYLTYFDDVLTERKASNYGKIDIFTELFQKRDAYGSTTLITCNYKDGCSLEDSLLEFGARYTGRVYDRLFSMFNVIELKGKSFRK